MHMYVYTCVYIYIYICPHILCLPHGVEADGVAARRREELPAAATWCRGTWEKLNGRAAFSDSWVITHGYI